MSRFHSIGCPSEWGRFNKQADVLGLAGAQFPFNWLPQRVGP